MYLIEQRESLLHEVPCDLKTPRGEVHAATLEHIARACARHLRRAALHNRAQVGDVLRRDGLRGAPAVVSRLDDDATELADTAQQH
tara:strand:+ start:1054 stop:1311 length:258 start_codon:yes stop_codon:yes gene_type:complete